MGIGVVTGPLMIGTPWYATLFSSGYRELLHVAPAARRLGGMTTDEEYEITRRIALLIEDEAENDTDGTDPKKLARDYVENVLDNGWISSGDDTPVWELVALLGYDRDDMDSLAVFHHLSQLIEENDFFNG